MLIRRKGRCSVLVGNSVWFTSDRLVVEVLTKVHFPCRVNLSSSFRGDWVWDGLVPSNTQFANCPTKFDINSTFSHHKKFVFVSWKLIRAIFVHFPCRVNLSSSFRGDWVWDGLVPSNAQFANCPTKFDINSTFSHHKKFVFVSWKLIRAIFVLPWAQLWYHCPVLPKFWYRT